MSVRIFIRNDDVRGSLDDSLISLTHAILDAGFAPGRYLDSECIVYAVPVGRKKLRAYCHVDDWRLYVYRDRTQAELGVVTSPVSCGNLIEIIAFGQGFTCRIEAVPEKVFRIVLPFPASNYRSGSV